MDYSEIHADILSTQIPELRKRHPGGLLWYYCISPNYVSDIERTLKREFPQRLVHVTSNQHHDWPAEFGTQVGGVFFGDELGQRAMKSMVAEALKCGLDDIYDNPILNRLLPQFNANKLEGGYMVINPKANRHIVALDLTPNQEHSYQIAKIKPTELSSSFRDLMAIAQKTVPETSKDFFAPNAHIDILMTEFLIRGRKVCYIDENIVNAAKGRMDLGKITGADIVKSLPHNLVTQGAANLKFIDDKVLCCSIESLGPMAQDLKEGGYKIVELGNHQFSLGGGVKCRSMDISWR